MWNYTHTAPPLITTIVTSMLMLRLACPCEVKTLMQELIEHHLFMTYQILWELV
jgi:hypothetical protein